MSNVALQSPLMQPIQYEGQTYYTSQYFHQQYLADSHYDGKYKRHRDYVRMARNIPAFDEYVAKADVVKLHWTRIKSEGAQLLRTLLQPLFEAAGYQSLMLINGTMQLAIANHLEDETSKRMAVTANTLVARQQIPAIDQYQDLKAIAEMARSVMSLASSAAESRQIAEAAKVESSQAKALAQSAIETQHFLTIREYVFLNDLTRQVPPSAQNAYGRWLTGYCLERGIPTRRIQVADRQYEAENGYHVGTMEATLSEWLLRRNGQASLHLITTQKDA